MVSERAAARNILDAGETAVVHLLHAADIVEADNAGIARVVKIALRRIDERKVSVFADPERDEHWRLFGEQSLVAIGFRSKVRGVAHEFVKRCQRHMIHQPLTEKAAERGRMARGQAGILVEMEGGDAPPVDGRVGAQVRREILFCDGAAAKTTATARSFSMAA